MDIEAEAVVATPGGKRPGEKTTLIEEAYRYSKDLLSNVKCSEDCGDRSAVTSDDMTKLGEMIRQAAIYDAQRTAAWGAMAGARDEAMYETKRLDVSLRVAQAEVRRRRVHVMKLEVAVFVLLGFMGVSIACIVVLL